MVQFAVGTINFSLVHSDQIGSGAHSASYITGSGNCLLGVKQQGHEADHSPSSHAEVKNGEAMPPLPPYAIMVWCLLHLGITLYCTLLIHSQARITQLIYCPDYAQDNWVQFLAEIFLFTTVSRPGARGSVVG
jgi:hypothetical protein